MKQTGKVLQFLMCLALVLTALAPVSVAPVQAEEGEYVFEAWVDFCDADTGSVWINGVDTRGPEQPFTFDWGDGTVEASWFVAHHVYSDTSQIYEVTITSAAGGEIQVEVDFSACPTRAFEVWLEEINPLTGFVRLNGFVSGSPLVVFDWGDGSEPTESFFPVEHYYQDTSREYEITVTGIFYDESVVTTTLPVTFTLPDLHRIEVWTTLEPYRIFGYGWDFGTPVTITVDDPIGGEILSDTVYPAPASWDEGYPLIEYEVDEGVLLPGRRVTLDDGTSRRELIISDVVVTLVNVFTDRVDGTASPGTHIETWFCNDDGARCAFRWMVVGEDGKWFADFAHPMDTGVPEEDNTVEITPYHYSTVVVRDEDDDKTVVHWVGLLPEIEVHLADNVIWNYNWPIGGRVNLEILENDEVVYTASAELETPDWNPEIFVTSFVLGDDFRLAPGQVVTLRHEDAPEMAKTHDIVDLRVTKVDFNADTLEGYAPPGSVVDTSYLCDDEDCAWRLSTADENGYWKADYGQPSGLNSGDPAFENTFDIQPGFCNAAHVFNDDRDSTMVPWCATIEAGDYGIYIFDPETGEITLLTRNLTGTDEYNPVWSHNGKKIAHDVLGADGSHSIYITDITTGISTPLAGAEDGGNDAAWSPNGKWIIFDRLAAGDASLYIVPATGGARQLVREDAISADWAPNGKRIVFQQPSDGSIRTAPVDGGKGGETLIAANGANPAWSPDGKWIAYEADGDIWVRAVNVLGVPKGAAIRLTSDAFQDGQPTWSPDSQTIVYHSGFGDDFDLWSVPAAGGEPTWLNGAPGMGDYDPAYARNHSLIAYASPSPYGQATRDWVAAFTYDLPAGYWSTGDHTYQFLAPD